MHRIVLVALFFSAAGTAATVQDIAFENDGLQLHGEVFLPAEGDALAGIVIIQGSGPSGTNNGWARQFAEQFSARGYAVLLPDKRGVGRSEGDWRSAGFEELAGDAVASLGALESHPRVAAGKVGFLGLSQGGHIAPLAGTLVDNIPFVINAVGSLVVMEEQLHHELRNAYLEHGLDEPTIEYLQEFARRSFDYLRDSSRWQAYLDMHREIAAGPLALAVETWPSEPDDPYWTFWGKVYDYDPLPHWRELAVVHRVPCLVLFGADDEQENVPVAASLRRAAPLQAEGTLTIEVFEDSGHALFEPGTRELRRDMLEKTDEFLRTALTRHAH